MNGEKTTFEKYFNKDDQNLMETKKPFIFKKICRGFETSEDNLEESMLELEEQIENIRILLAQEGQVDKIKILAEKLVEHKYTAEILEVIRAEKKTFVG